MKPPASAAALATSILLAGALAPGAAARTHDCRSLPGGGTAPNPWRIPAPNLKRTAVRCPGFPAGQGAQDYYVFRVPGKIDRNDHVTVRSRPSPSAPSEVSLALDDPGPRLLDIRGFRFERGPYVFRRVVLARVKQLTVGTWRIRTERRARAGAPGYRLSIDLR